MAHLYNPQLGRLRGSILFPETIGGLIAQTGRAQCVYMSKLRRLCWHGVRFGLRSSKGCNRGHFRPEATPASAFRTSDCEIPNCRAIRDGVTPTLKAARTAFNFPLVNGSGTCSTRRLRGLSSKSGGFLPRRCCSAEATATNWSSSASVSRFIAFGRSLGRTWRTAGS